MERFGYKKVISRCDDENAMLDLLRAVKQRTNIETSIQTIPKGSHASRGVGEQVQGHIAGMVRTTRLSLEQKIGHPISIDSILGHWVVKYAACCYNRFSKDGGGKTPFFKVTGAGYVIHMHEFGEIVLAHQRVIESKYKMRAYLAVWVGISEGNGENIMLTREGARTVRTTHRIAGENRWNPSYTTQQCGAPFDTMRGRSEEQPRDEQLHAPLALVPEELPPNAENVSDDDDDDTKEAIENTVAGGPTAERERGGDATPREVRAGRGRGPRDAASDEPAARCPAQYGRAQAARRACRSGRAFALSTEDDGGRPWITLFVMGMPRSSAMVTSEFTAKETG